MVTSVILRFQAPAQCPRRPAWPSSRAGHPHCRVGEIELLLEEGKETRSLRSWPTEAAGRLAEGLEAGGRGRRRVLHGYLPPKTENGLSPLHRRTPRAELLRGSLESAEVRHSRECEYL